MLSLKAIVDITNVLHISHKYLSNKPMRCLIVTTTGVGDTIWGTPAIRSLKESLPELHISVLTNPNGEELLMRNPFIDKSFIFKKGILNLLSLIKELQKSRFDTVIVFHATDRLVWLLAHLTGAGSIIGSIPHSKETGFVITHPVTIPAGLHSIYARLLLIKKLGIEFNIREKIEMFLSDNERKWAEDFLKGMEKENNSIVIGLQPGAAKLYKRWPEKKFIRLGQVLKTTMNNVIILITGDSKEEELSERIAKETGGISLAGRLTLRETAAVIERCNLFITNDTGPLHLAVALGTPTIALFSATGIENVTPYASLKSFRFISKPKPCNPCISKVCKSSLCMEQISVEEVFETVKEEITKPNIQRFKGL